MIFDRGGKLPIRPADNPFASHRIDALDFRPPGPKPEDLAERLDALGGWADVVGPKGSGKTMLLEELSWRLDGDIVLVNLPGPCRDPWRAIQRRLPDKVGSEHTVLVDAAGRLGAPGRLKLRRRASHARRLVTTRHRPGRLPILIECQTSPELLLDLVKDLAPDHAEQMESELWELFERHHGNLRMCFRELYDVFAGIM